jgi:hypothetical protein
MMTEYREPDVAARTPDIGATTPPVPAPTTDEPSMKDRAGEAAQTGKDAAGNVASTAQDKAKDVIAEGKRQAGNVVGEAQDQVRQQVGTQHRNLVTNLRSLGNELHSMSERSDQNGTATDLVSQAGDRAHGVASWLDEREPGEVVDEVRAFARRRPGVFLAACFGLGIAAGRLTRGVVAAHSEDSDDSAPSTRASYPGGLDTGATVGTTPTPQSAWQPTTSDPGAAPWEPAAGDPGAASWQPTNPAGGNPSALNEEYPSTGGLRP